MTQNAVETARLLVVSREAAILRPLWSLGESNSWQLETAGTGWEAMERLQSGSAPDLLILDLPKDDSDSLHILRWLRRLRPELPIVLISYAEDIGRRKEALRLGAQDYLVRPLSDAQLEHSIQRHLSSTVQNAELDLASEDVERVSEDAFFVGASPAMRKLRAQAELLAETNVPVLILGESGSGKDTVAHLIHNLSVRSGMPFAKVNCAALPGDLLDRELFGQGSNGHSGSQGFKAGKLELCDRGTVLLDEITEMPAELQTKLVKLLQTKQFDRSGSGIAASVDVRILAATTANVERAISERKMREDLYYRLSAFTVQVPALRNRKDEIPLLLQHFMHHLAKHYNLPARGFSSSVVEACQSHSWPGNLKELESFVKRYLVMGDDELSMSGPGHASNGDPETPYVSRFPVAGLTEPGQRSAPASLKAIVQGVKLEAERNAIAAALEQTRWNRKAAARLLKVSYRTLLYKIEQYHMTAADTASLVGNGARINGSGNGNGIKVNGRVS